MPSIYYTVMIRYLCWYYNDIYAASWYTNLTFYFWRDKSSGLAYYLQKTIYVDRFQFVKLHINLTSMYML